MINGYCDERFTEARKIFEESIASGFELGCAISLEVDGEKVIDLWGGYSNPDKTELWKEDTIVNVFSTSRFNLIESLANQIASLLTDDYCLSGCRVIIRKPDAPINGILDTVEVEVMHHG